MLEQSFGVILNDSVALPSLSQIANVSVSKLK
jgi:hypothetical protein